MKISKDYSEYLKFYAEYMEYIHQHEPKDMEWIYIINDKQNYIERIK